MPITPKLSVFISHAKEEAKLAQILQRRISNDFIGLIRVFVSSDHKSIESGSEWLREVIGALRSADVFLFVCSKGVEERPWINIELGAALVRNSGNGEAGAGGQRLVPVCHTDLEPAKLQGPLAVYEALKGSDAAGIEALYTLLADRIGSAVPCVDFTAIAREVAAFEDWYRCHKNALQCSLNEQAITKTTEYAIIDPRVLCVSSRYFEQAAHEHLEAIRGAFPEGIKGGHLTSLSSADVRRILAEKAVDVIHVAARVCPETGDLSFDEADVSPGPDCAHSPDLLSASNFVELVKESEASLVVIANGEGFPLAARILGVTNVVFATDRIDVNMLATWIHEFYSLLAEYPLAEACRKASLMAQAQMRLYPRLSGEPALVFRAGRAAA